MSCLATALAGTRDMPVPTGGIGPRSAAGRLACPSVAAVGGGRPATADHLERGGLARIRSLIAAAGGGGGR
ncbi:hypothetical protein [Streptomyces shenzhenensis]|uniref:hypothetical protein n=1 Tax=Streptomyces shenzhenensis TaxID=943815 RepID=UPI001F17A748|nr:hypothetical protein [Streptomyces shenzhenensis]